jgi:hypothetical protein
LLNTNEVRARAAAFAEEWKNASYEKGEAQSFYNDFFQVFGVKRRQVATFEEPVKKLGGQHGFIDLFWKGVLLVEHKSAGRDLIRAKGQALDYFPNLKQQELPRYVLVSDFQNFELYDLEGKSAETKFKLADLPRHVEAFNFIRGLEKREFKDQDPVNIEASELVGELHDALEATGYKGHDLERFLVRLVFCLFADDTGIFEPRSILLDFLQNRTNEDGSDTGALLMQLFDVLNTPEKERQSSLDEDLAEFPYVNGDLFAERLRPPSFNAKMRKLLIEACEFGWNAISPAIFGALFQSVMDARERRKKGAHYTTELNILKLIRPLFLDRLHVEFEEIKGRRGADRRSKLVAFQDKIAGLTFFDPACGSGNFLIITYRELRRLEIAILKELHPARQREFDVTTLSKLDVDRFYGIEIEEFSARIAESAMWMMDHIMNNELSLAFGQNYARIPLKKSASILNADALETDWAVLLPPGDCSYVFGNPPFSGAKTQSEAQRAQVRRIANMGGSGGTLDYVAAWFLKAGAYVSPKNCHAEIAFVATNSVTQGEQVAQLWPLLFSRYGLEISFAHRTFAWGSDARGKAHVHVVIIGLTKRAFEWADKRLFSYDDIDGDPVESRHRVLSPYLFDASGLRDRHLVVEETTKPLSPRPRVSFGNMPNDGGFLILSAEEFDLQRAHEPDVADFVRPLLGAEDFINGKRRYCLWLVGSSPEQFRQSDFIKNRIGEVRRYRLKSTRDATRKLAETPALFGEIRQVDGPFILIPRHSSEGRQYVPMGFFDGLEIAHDSCLFCPGATPFDFGILTSSTHMSWLRNIGGRLKSDFRYSIGIVYNTFPWLEASDSQKEKISILAREVLNVRSKFTNATLADLYDPDTMPSELRKAHRKLDDAVDSLYKRGGFASDRERVEHLFMLYEKLVSPLAAAAGGKRRRKKAS